jgi:WD40 repeat protein
MPHRGQVWAVALSADGRIAATGGDDGTVHFWDADNQRPRGVPLANRWPIRSMALAPDARTVLVGSWQESSRLWDVATTRPSGPPIPHEGAVLAAAFERGAPRALMVAEDRTVRSLPLSGVPGGEDEPIGLWIKVATGMELDAQGGANLLEPGTWEQYRRQLRSNR